MKMKAPCLLFLSALSLFIPTTSFLVGSDFRVHVYPSTFSTFTTLFGDAAIIDY